MAADPPGRPGAGQSDVSYTISTVAGNGQASFSGDGGPATQASLNRPCAVAVDAAGNLFIADYGNSRIRKVSPDGIITTLAGSGEAGYGGDGGPATSASLRGPYGVQVDTAGNVYIADQQNCRIRKVAKDGIITTVAGNGQRGFAGDGGPATEAKLSGPNDMLPGRDGELIIADSGNDRLRRVNANGIITTIAGTGERGDNPEGGMPGDGGPALKARLATPSTLTRDPAGNLILGDFRNHAVRKITPDGIITTIAGMGRRGFSRDGVPAKEARFNELGGVAVDLQGRVVFTDGVNYRVRRVGRSGVIETIAGTGQRGFAGDGGPATEAKLSVLDNLVVDARGNLYVTDHRNNRIRKLTPTQQTRAGGS
jgi:sugar lactone lactonase YvrE